MSRLRCSLVAIALILPLGCSSGSAVCSPRASHVVPSPPPAPLPEQQSNPTTPNQEWVAGYWHWDGLRYVWIPGRWVTPPEGHKWAAAHTNFDSETGQYVFREGGFCR